MQGVNSTCIIPWPFLQNTPNNTVVVAVQKRKNTYNEIVYFQGDAKAFAVEAKAKAEAEQMAKKADAWNEYGKAALMDMMLKMMPKVAAEIAEPLSKANKVTMISDNASDIGASKLTGEVLSIMGAIPDTVHKMTGVNIAKQMTERRA